MQSSENYHSGFIAIIGRPNVGKSTFMNYVIGQKVAIMSDKPQTTRNKIQGVLTTDTYQLIFIDTPGIHKPKHRLGDFMVKSSIDTLNEVDAIMFMVNAKEGYGKGDEFIIEKLKGISQPVLLVINKIDEVHPDELLPLIDQYRENFRLPKLCQFPHCKEIMLTDYWRYWLINCLKAHNIIQKIM